MRRGLLLALALGWMGHAVAGDELYPLRVGSWWEYKVSGENYGTITNRIAESRVIDGVTWYRLIDHGDTFWIRNGRDGQIEAIALYGTDARHPVDDLEETLVFKYPVTPNETYRMGEDRVKVTGERTVTLPAGEFVCTMYVIEMGDGSRASHCITPGVGTIEIEFITGGRRSISTLVDYHIAD